jgi:methionyl-tRNA formyltransferase
MRRTKIDPDEDAPALLARLTALGVEMLGGALADPSPRKPQEGEPSAAPLIKREDARVDLARQDAKTIHDLVRGFRAWPKAWLQLEKGSLQLLKTEVGEPGDGVPGTVVAVDRTRGVLVQCSSCSRLWFLEVQPEGKKPLNAAEFANGLRLAAGGFLPLPK